MLRLAGVGASPGIAMGVAHFLGGRVEVQERRIFTDEVSNELRRFEDAIGRSDTQLRRIQQQIAEQVGDGQEYRILEAHRMMLADVHLVEETRRIISSDQVSAEWALRRALDQIQAVFARIEDAYFRERRSDIDMIGERILRNLMGMTPPGHEGVPKGAVVFAHDLSPADVTQLGRAGVSGFFTEGGGKTSHSALVARALGLPLVAGVQGFIKHIRTGMTVIVDGGRGEVILEPDTEVQGRFADRAARDLVQTERLSRAREAPAISLDGERVHLAANVELLEEVPISVELGADGIGLFRTEFLYLERSTLPTEEEQYQHALAALRAMDGRGVCFRTLDLGGDKLPTSVRIPAGNNPALGLRSIRYSLWRRDVFKSQLRAFYRAAVVGPLRIMFPLISGVAELRTVRELCAGVCAELQRDGLEHNPEVPLGVMIETPSAAVIADLLVEECDFLSIGTNDLIQYALAADRQDEHVGYLYHPLHPAILRLIKTVTGAAKRAGKPVAMCGDMAGDPRFCWVLLGLGLRSLSMAPRQIPRVKSIVRATRIASAEKLTEEILRLRTEDEVEELVNRVMKERFPVEFTEETS
ncbi:MAG: phosphoenolpyruvate--protein phosphotransferase [Polyangia bacterium]|jgi:phosphotransferase system enzyme I (PtsI)